MLKQALFVNVERRILKLSRSNLAEAAVETLRNLVP